MKMMSVNTIFELELLEKLFIAGFIRVDFRQNHLKMMRMMTMMMKMRKMSLEMRLSLRMRMHHLKVYLY